MGATSSRTTETDPRLAAAAAELERERRRATDEIDAFRRFESRVRSIDPEVPPRRETEGFARTVAFEEDCESSEALAEVREAYEETVMAVPHYEEDYDDTYAESLRAEFDASLATALVDGNSFGKRCRAMLLSATAEAKTARQSLLAAVADEKDSLTAATNKLETIIESLDTLSEQPLAGESFGALDAYRARLEQLTRNCEAVLRRRQEAVFDQRRAVWLPADAPDIARYFYQSLDIDYPVMAVIADLLDRIDALRSSIERAMSYCHA